MIFPDVEAGNLAISQVEDVTDLLVLEPVCLTLQRPALQIRHRLTDLHDDRSIRIPGKSQGLDVGADNGPLARPVFADTPAAVDVPALHAIGPGDVISECVEHTVDVSRVEAVIDGPKNREIVSHSIDPHDEAPERQAWIVAPRKMKRCFRATQSAPTLRLALGADAVKSIREMLACLTPDVNQSEAVAVTTNF